MIRTDLSPHSALYLLHSALLPSVRRPNPRRRQLPKVVVRVAEVEADAAAGPADLALDGDAALREPGAPRFEILGGDGESEVDGTGAVVGRDGAAGER